MPEPYPDYDKLGKTVQRLHPHLVDQNEPPTTRAPLPMLPVFSLEAEIHHNWRHFPLSVFDFVRAKLYLPTIEQNTTLHTTIHHASLIRAVADVCQSNTACTCNLLVLPTGDALNYFSVGRALEPFFESNVGGTTLSSDRPLDNSVVALIDNASMWNHTINSNTLESFVGPDFMLSGRRTFLVRTFVQNLLLASHQSLQDCPLLASISTQPPVTPHPAFIFKVQYSHTNQPEAHAFPFILNSMTPIERLV